MPPTPGPDGRPDTRSGAGRDFAARDFAARSVKRLRPHRRRASAGQATGLDPNLQSDLPSWLAQARVATAQPRRLRSLAIAALAALLGAAVVAGAQTAPRSFGYVVFGVQVIFVLAWTVAMRPPGAVFIAVIGLITAGCADITAVLAAQPSLTSQAYVAATAFGAAVAVQLARGKRRSSPTEAMGASLTVVVGVIALAMLIVLNRHTLGTQSIVACLGAAGVALAIARLVDVVLPFPRVSSQVPRGAIGVVIGAMAATVAAAVVGSYLVGLTPAKAAGAALVTAMAALMADLGVSYADAGRELDGDPPPFWLARHMQGPVGGFALAAPTAYVLSVLVLVPSL